MTHDIQTFLAWFTAWSILDRVLTAALAWAGVQ